MFTNMISIVQLIWILSCFSIIYYIANISNDNQRSQSIFTNSFLTSTNSYKTNKNDANLLNKLDNICLDSTHLNEYWTYILCYKQHITQVHIDKDSNNNIINGERQNIFEKYIESPATFPSSKLNDNAIQYYRSHNSDCSADGVTYIQRNMQVQYKCCDNIAILNYIHLTSSNAYETHQYTFIESITEPNTCNYIMNICTELLCSPSKSPLNTHMKLNSLSPSPYHSNLTDADVVDPLSPMIMSVTQQSDLKERVRR